MPPRPGRAREIARDLTELSVAYDDWQIVYRQILQLERAVRGEPQILAGMRESHAEAMRAQSQWSDGVDADHSTRDVRRETQAR